MTTKSKRRRTAESYWIWKRILDIVFSALLLIFLAPVMLGIAVAVRIGSPGGALFRQKRIGRGGRVFTCYKFRSMCRDAPCNRPTADFPDAGAYITSVGRFLRRTSLDELPQLWNVLRGDMSLIGPRPLICEETEMHRMRNSGGVYRVRPGITGLAQVSGRDLLNDREKARLDIRYCRNMSFRLDVGILGRTFLRVISGAGMR